MTILAFLSAKYNINPVLVRFWKKYWPPGRYFVIFLVWDKKNEGYIIELTCVVPYSQPQNAPFVIFLVWGKKNEGYIIELTCVVPYGQPQNAIFSLHLISDKKNEGYIIELTCVVLL